MRAIYLILVSIFNLGALELKLDTLDLRFSPAPDKRSRLIFENATSRRITIDSISVPKYDIPILYAQSIFYTYLGSPENRTNAKEFFLSYRTDYKIIIHKNNSVVIPANDRLYITDAGLDYCFFCPTQPLNKQTVFNPIELVITVRFHSGNEFGDLVIISYQRVVSIKGVHPKIKFERSPNYLFDIRGRKTWFSGEESSGLNFEKKSI